MVDSSTRWKEPFIFDCWVLHGAANSVSQMLECLWRAEAAAAVAAETAGEVDEVG